MSNQHSPGKWFIAGYNQSYQPLTPDDHPNKEIIIREKLDTPFKAISIGTENGQVALIPLDESNEANAKLIVTCPEMYLFLSDFIGALRDKAKGKTGLTIWEKAMLGSAQEIMKKIHS